MKVRTIVTLCFAAMAGVAIYAIVMVTMNERTVVNVADWDPKTRALKLAAPMPSCACLTLRPRDRSAVVPQISHLWSRITGLRFGRDPLLDPKDVILVSRLNQGTTMGQMALRHTEVKGTWAFAFDWAGSAIGSNYEVRAYGVKEEVDAAGGKHLVPDQDVGPLDMNAMFTMTALLEKGCVEQELNECPWGDLALNGATGSAIGQNNIESSFSGVRFARQDRVLEAQATGKYRGSPGDCGCMLLQTIRAPFTLSGAMSGTALGQLVIGQAGTLLGIPYDYAGPRGDAFYELTVNGGDERVSDYVRVLGELDGMECLSDAATFTLASPAPQPGDESSDAARAAAIISQVLTCKYDLEDPAQKVTGGLNLMKATAVYNPIGNVGSGATLTTTAPAIVPPAPTPGTRPPAGVQAQPAAPVKSKQ
jgi:hypothetical protein